ncbi:MAG: tetratricopeptide repeat protein [candidate division KSB1 bacterium]|nr:tetratricopeptide repeat protein [candidate division KSB1 bacterium]MDZ7317521.1 tetratricopeptide repeat protein [candidate division KSB1 bacterium]MDZ7340914.1 tetratricopeptide repeat protein [candidate division KSB1 bacterium]
MNGQHRFQRFAIICFIPFVILAHLSYGQEDATSWFNRGTAAASAQEKITCYLQAVKLNPKFIEAYYNLGYVYKSLDDYENAERSFRQALLSDPARLDNETKLRIAYELGMTLKRLNRLNEALEMMQAAKNLAVKTEIRAAVLYEMGRLKIAMGNYDEAIADFQEGLLLNSTRQSQFQSGIQNANAMKEIEKYYAQGINFLEKGQYDDAIKAFNYVINENPNYKNVAQKLAQARSAKEKPARPDELENTYARGLGYLKNNDWKNAILAFSQVEQQNPNYKDVKAKLEEAKTKLDQSLVEEGYEKLYNDGLAAFKEGNWVKALIAFEKVREWNPSYKNIGRMYNDTQNKLNQEEQGSVKNRYYSQGKSDLANGNWQAAIVSFRQLIRLDPNYRDVQELLSQAEGRSRAEAQLEQQYAEAMTHFNNGDWLKAIVSLEQIQQIDPNYMDVKEKIAQAQENYNKTQSRGEKTLASTPMESPKSPNRKWLLIGGILSLIMVPVGIALLATPSNRAKFYLMQGNFPKAAMIYESTLMKKPHKMKLYPALASIYLLQNRTDETAMKVYEISLQQKIDPQMRQKMLEITNGKSFKKIQSDPIENLEEKLKQELERLKKSA